MTINFCLIIYRKYKGLKLKFISCITFYKWRVFVYQKPQKKKIHIFLYNFGYLQLLSSILNGNRKLIWELLRKTICGRKVVKTWRGSHQTKKHTHTERDRKRDIRRETEIVLVNPFLLEKLVNLIPVTKIFYFVKGDPIL